MSEFKFDRMMNNRIMGFFAGLSSLYRFSMMLCCYIYPTSASWIYMKNETTMLVYAAGGLFAASSVLCYL